MGKGFLVEPYNPVTAGSGSGAVAPSTVYDLFNDYIGVEYVAAALPAGSDYVEMNFGGIVPVNVVAFLSTSGSTPTWEIRAANTAIGLDTPAFTTGTLPFLAGSIAPTSGRRHSLAVFSTLPNYHYWRIYATNPASPFTAGRLVLGRRVEPTRNFSFGAAFGAIDRGGGDFSNMGVWLPKPGVVQRTVGLTWSFVTKQEAEGAILPLVERIGNGKFILLVTDGDADAQRERRMYFGPIQGSLETVWRSAIGFELRVNLVSVI